MHDVEEQRGRGRSCGQSASGGSAQPQDDAGSSAVPALRLRRSNEIDSDEEAEGA